MLNEPEKKYARFQPVGLTDRQWPGRTIDRPPMWMSTDLRDGNQSLVEPMSTRVKLRFFQALVAIGFKQIEVGFPSASQTDFDFVRLLIAGHHIPDDVTIEVLTQARQALIERTIESLAGAPRAIVHLYNPIAPDFRERVYQRDRAAIRAIAEQGTEWVKQAVARHPDTEWTYQYSPEAFSGTELDYAAEVVDAVSAIWQPDPQQPLIINLPATVELSTPNTYADQIEWMDRHIARRDSIILSVHPHNDRGTAVAAAELAIMAGAERVEGCLFGHGERTGNVDLITLALNLYSQGIHPGLDFSRIDELRQLVEEVTRIPVHPRHPYAGELVFTAFSGSHQDAIKKGFAQQQANERWRIPYLPIDPADLGRSYESVVRVNSQSGKAGVSFLLARAYGMEIPRRLQIEFSRLVQQHTEQTGSEASEETIAALFEHHYLAIESPLSCVQFEQHSTDAEVHVALNLHINEQQQRLPGNGSGPVEAMVNALQPLLTTALRIKDYHEHALGDGAESKAVCYLEVSFGESASIFGVGQDHNLTAAALHALINGINRAVQAGLVVLTAQDSNQTLCSQRQHR